jgi:hypothetical protein
MRAKIVSIHLQVMITHLGAASVAFYWELGSPYILCGNSSTNWWQKVAENEGRPAFFSKGKMLSKLKI